MNYRLPLLIFSVWAAVDARVGPVGLRELIERPYLELAAAAQETRFAAEEFDKVRAGLAKEKEEEQQKLARAEKDLAGQLAVLRRELDRMNRAASRDTEESAERRRVVHCRILKLEQEARDKRTAREHGVPVAFENRRAKLDLLQQWPAREREIAAAIQAGQARSRRWGNVEDIGVRKIAEGQEKDIKRGEEAVRELRQYGLLPPEYENREARDYIDGLAKAIAAGSDVTVPVKLHILDSVEINAFALPGGLLYVNTGLIEKAETESELAGVIAHELAHVSARHGAKMMRRATIAGIIYQSAQVAALILTGGVATIGAYYALQYGFFGLGMVLDLALLGVNREYEAEADQLGVQYAWRSGYDPRGFITFFDKMASDKGYVRSTSFFRTHPPFFERILASFSEIEYLPRTGGQRVDSSGYQQMKQAMRAARKKADSDRKAPKLRRIPECGDEKRNLLGCVVRLGGVS